jgi:hypothetical protein
MFSGKYALVPLEYQRNNYCYVPMIDSPLRFTSKRFNKVIILNEIFNTDLASTPRILWAIPRFGTGDYPRSALVHDWIYELHHRKIELASFREANSILEEAMLIEGAPKSVAYAWKKACDWFGGGIWNR